MNATKVEQNCCICLSKTIISKAVSHGSLQRRFTTMTCWHFISTYFLRASFAVIFLVLTSSLQHWSSMVKRVVLCAVSSLTQRKRSVALGLLCFNVNASEHPGNTLVSNFFSSFFKCCAHDNIDVHLLSSFWMFVWSAALCLVHLFHRAIFDFARSGPPLSVFDKLSLTLCISECQFVKYPKWGVTCLQS